MIEKHRAVVLVSGGMDSLVTAAMAFKVNEFVCFMHVNYGQKTESKELDCYNKLVEYYLPEKSLNIDMKWLGDFGGSALTDNTITISNHKNSNEIPLTYVPFRNAILLSAAVAWAETIEADRVYIGAVEEDGSGYPDCLEIFFRSYQRVINAGIKRNDEIQIMTPVINLTKAEIIETGMSLKAPLELSWSCYRNNEAACGKCDSCVLRLKAFKQAGFEDPLPYLKEEDV